MKQLTVKTNQRFSDWQRKLTSNGNAAHDAEVPQRQQALRAAVRDGPDALVAYLREQLGVPGAETIAAPLLPRNIEPGEFRNPPLELEVECCRAWKDKIEPRQAAQPLFWTLCHIRWIEAGRLGAQLEASLCGALESGNPPDKLEAATRNLLRRLGGLPHVRGKVSVLSDCPLARAWWRGMIARQASDTWPDRLDPETAHRVLHSNNDAWARLVGDSVRRITTINHSQVRAALINHYRDASRIDGGLVPQELQLAAQIIARQSEAVLFSAMASTELTALTAAAVEQARRSVASAPTT